MKSQGFLWPQALCWMVLGVLVGLGLCDDMTFLIHEDFEESEKTQRNWFTNNKDSHFRIVNGTHGSAGLGPRVDATTGTSKGQYSLADYDAFNNFRWMYSNCVPPSGTGCTLNFSAVIELKEDEEFVVCAMKQCTSCQTIHFNPDECEHLNNRTESWREMSVRIGSIPTPFDISFGVSFLHPGSFLALDDIQLLDCDRGNIPVVTCTHEEFQCDYTDICLTRDRLCDLHPDCVCEEDEGRMCDDIPLEGLLDLKQCNFYSGNCLWYNVGQDDLGEPEEDTTYRWQVVDSQLTFVDNGDSDTTSFGPAFEKENNTHLLVELLPHDPPIPASLRSVTFPPRMSLESYCQIRFLYQLTNATLQLDLMTRGEDDVTKRELWSMSDEDFLYENSYEWHRAVVDIDGLHPTHTHYVLQLTATFRGSSDETPVTPGYAGLHRLTLDVACFTPDLTLTTCDNHGHIGPSASQCLDYYHGMFPVDVIQDGQQAGVQEWIVPETGVYRFQAFGAGGGVGIIARNLVANSRGARVQAKFKLTEGDRVFALVGQTGMEACPQESWAILPTFCRHNESFPVEMAGGGGGGGGATIVYKRDKFDNLDILIVAGGGGGLPAHFDEETAQGSDKLYDGQEDHEMTSQEAAHLFAGRLEGADGCRDSSNRVMYWGGRGGFGAGGGACASGGHGGGADASKSQDGGTHLRVGAPGRSYVHPSSIGATIKPDFSVGDGRVDITSEWHCPCAYRCLWLDDKLEEATCVCPQGQVLQHDGISCSVWTNVTTKADESDSSMLPIYIGIGVACFLALVTCVCLYVKWPNLRNRCPHSMKKVSFIVCPCMTLNRRSQVFGTHSLPQMARAPAVMHENPHYNLVTTSDNGLHEVNRKHLTLISELGQGAFGQVFYGQLSHVPTVGELPVAVKTLPAFSTEQTEMDFLLEAVIVSKFNHPNIVQFIGVCFEQHPHFLVLELLEGGDLKTFLRHGRPKWDQPSTLTMLDLLRLALDVARGCQHLEEKHFIHRDIAARNCLLTTKGPNRIAKIADFGMARDIYRSDYYKKAGKAMLPVKWMPPEAFLDGLFTAKTDVWSYGILLWEVFSLGHVPYPGCSNEEVMNLVTKGGRLDPPTGCPSAIFDVLISCWAGMAESRPTFALIISILERTIQDDETVSKGLPVCYVPPPIHPAGVRIRDGSLSPRPFPISSTGATCAGHRSPRLRVAPADFDNDQGYLKPLLSDIDSTSPFPRSMFLNPLVNAPEPKSPTGASLCASGNQRHPWEKDRAKGAHGRVPKVFYRPGTCDVTIESQSGNSNQSQASAANDSDNKT